MGTQNLKKVPMGTRDNLNLIFASSLKTKENYFHLLMAV